MSSGAWIRGPGRMSWQHGGRRESLRSAPTFGPASGLVRGGWNAQWETPQRSPERIDEYRRIGIDSFILSGYPHLEEAYRFSELVFPLLPLDHPVRQGASVVNMGPFGETVAGNHRPLARQASSS